MVILIMTVSLGHLNLSFGNKLNPLHTSPITKINYSRDPYRFGGSNFIELINEILLTVRQRTAKLNKENINLYAS